MDDGSDLATAHLPPDAARPRFTMNRQRDRDQVACLLGRDGWRAFERPLPELIFRYGVAHPGLFVDVGANTGFYTLLAASASRDNHVVALEPMADILELLRRNLADNGLVDRVRLIRCAAGERNSEQDLYVPSPAHRLIETSASLLGSFKGEHSSTERVLVRTLDRILFRPSLIGRRVTMIKIDVEGLEAAVIEGARWTVRRHRPIVFAEVLPHADFDALNRFLDLNRYVVSASVRSVRPRSPRVSRSTRRLEPRPRSRRQGRVVQPGDRPRRLRGLTSPVPGAESAPTEGSSGKGLRDRWSGPQAERRDDPRT